MEREAAADRTGQSAATKLQFRYGRVLINMDSFPIMVGGLSFRGPASNFFSVCLDNDANYSYFLTSL